MKHLGNRRRDRVYLALALGLLAASPGHSAEPDWPPGPYNYFVVDQDLRSVLQEFARHLDLPIRMSERIGAIRIKGKLSGSSAREFLQWICDSYRLVWYFDGSILHVYDQTELRSEFLDRGPVSLAELVQRLERAGIADPRFPIRATGDDRLITVVGPPIYTGLVRRVLATMIETAARSPVSAASARQSVPAEPQPNADAGADSEPLRHQRGQAAAPADASTAPNTAGAGEAGPSRAAATQAAGKVTGAADIRTDAGAPTAGQPPGPPDASGSAAVPGEARPRVTVFRGGR